MNRLTIIAALSISIAAALSGCGPVGPDETCKDGWTEVDRRRMGAWASFEHLAASAHFAGREGYAGIARLAAARSRHFAALGSAWNIDRALAAYYRALAILLFRAARWQS